MVVTVENRLTPQMQQLREMSYDDFICGPDEFDRHSLHITAWEHSEAVGMVRLTPGPEFALPKWSSGRFTTPAGSHVIEMTRGVVHPEFRRHGIYKTLMFESMIRAKSLGMRIAIAAVKLDFVGKPFLHSLGFVDVQELCWFDNHFLAQPIQCELNQNERWSAMYAQHASKTRSQNIEIHSETLPDPGAAGVS